ncbi:hypothetical protein BDB00DRAFT_927785 [Zychaea mexicana]|uniref:uncharacterized protein n=1 Tax=Zychaea mexicana TaxID=64656 RepID=UPI0022FF3B63|nr:uncharacterized protein BDB00DRAFT_927785 [Zychaea mexicana]KAI9495098.1 hypothetical protein BDB00DRAFT_927785 [Zychaea mexicana]
MNIQIPQYAFIGLGAIGFETSQHIHKHLVSTGGKPLLVHNRTLARAEALKAKVPDIQVAETIKTVAEQADIIFTCLLNDAVVKDVIDNLLAHGLKKDSIIVEQSTIAPDVSQELASKVERYGAHFVACPFMGPPAKARVQGLIILAGGRSQVLEEKVLPILVPATGPKVIRTGEQPRQALQLKLTGNFFVTSFVEMLGEGMTLAQASGIGQDKVKDLMDGLFPGTLLPMYADRMNRNTYENEIHFPLTSAKKDATHILNMGKEYNTKLPITELFLSHLESVHKEHGDWDMSSIVCQLRKEAGLKNDGSKP